MPYEVYPLEPDPDHISHYGAKGMKWGVRKTRDGGGVLKVSARPTYTTAERRSAQAAVKTAAKSGSKALDSGGFDQARLARLRTPSRRVVNAFLGTKISWIMAGAQVAGAGVLAATIMASTAPLSVPVLAGGIAAIYAAGAVGSTHAAYKTLFSNMVNNPKIRLKTKLTPDEMARYQVGKDVRRHLTNEHGSVKFSSLKGTTKISVIDKEGRSVGGQTTTPKISKAKPDKIKRI